MLNVTTNACLGFSMEDCMIGKKVCQAIMEEIISYRWHVALQTNTSAAIKKGIMNDQVDVII